MTAMYGSNYSQWGYSFDNFGNLTNGMTFPKIGTSEVPVNNRPSSYTSGGTTINFSYDQSGNMTAAGATTYQWDGANRLKSVNTGTLGSYGFDGNGKRVRKAESGATTYYVYSSVIGSAVMEVASAGVQRAYLMNGGSVIAQRNADGQFYWLHTDHLGSGRKMTDTSGTMTYRAEFDPYGKLLLEWSLGNQVNRNSKKFTSYERDQATGLDYAEARMYSSDWGRFMSPDPSGLANANKLSPKSFNRYSYVEGNPVNFVDPTGLGIVDFLKQVFSSGVGKQCSPGSWCISTVEIGAGSYYSWQGISYAEAQLALFWQQNQAVIPNFLPVEGKKRGLGPDDLRDSVYTNKALVQKINDCLKGLLATDYAKIGEQSINNAPKIDATKSLYDITKTYRPDMIAKGQLAYSFGRGPGQSGNLGGNYGTVIIGSEKFNDATQWEKGGQYQDRSQLVNAFVHELGNIISYRLYGDNYYFGDPKASDSDSGYKLQLCVWGT